MKTNNSKRKQAKDEQFKQKAINLTVAVIVLLIAYLFQDKYPEVLETFGLGQNETQAELPSGTLYTHFMDVGQGDSTLIQTKNAAMLIDGGEAKNSQMLVDYIKSQGITKLDYLIATHPHSDHIGSLSQIVKNFEIDVIMMPKVESSISAYEKLLTEMAAKSLKATVPTPGYKFTMDGASFTVLAPTSDSYDNLNNASIGLKVVYGQHRFIYTGDAEKLAEDEMLATGLDLSADFYHVGHHGSKTSTSVKFLNAVSPAYAFISCGHLNDYGHPNEEILARLDGIGAAVYRTDRLGTIVLESTGVDFRITSESEGE